MTDTPHRGLGLLSEGGPSARALLKLPRPQLTSGLTPPPPGRDHASPRRSRRLHKSGSCASPTWRRTSARSPAVGALSTTEVPAGGSDWHPSPLRATAPASSHHARYPSCLPRGAEPPGRQGRATAPSIPRGPPASCCLDGPSRLWNLAPPPRHPDAPLESRWGPWELELVWALTLSGGRACEPQSGRRFLPKVGASIALRAFPTRPCEAGGARPFWVAEVRGGRTCRLLGPPGDLGRARDRPRDLRDGVCDRLGVLGHGFASRRGSQHRSTQEFCLTSSKSRPQSQRATSRMLRVL